MMRSSTRRLGLSFEIAPPHAPHPNRTDIAFFAGTIARRALAEAPRAMPAVLARWLTALGFPRIGDVVVELLFVDLDTPARFVESLLLQAKAAERTALSHALAFDQLDTAAAARKTAQLAELVAACRALTPLPVTLIDGLAERGFVPQRLLGPDELAGWLRVQRLINLPIMVESFEEVERLFAWERRPVLDLAWRDGDPKVATSLGVAVRAFFNEGGCRCWIVRTGNPSSVFMAARERFAACFPQPGMPAGESDGATATDRDPDRCPLFPGVGRIVRLGLLSDVHIDDAPLTPEPSAWQGLEHLYGLNEVSYACLPDFIDACAQAVPALIAPASEVASPEAFHDCVAEAAPESPHIGRRLPPPTLNPLGLEVWRKLVVRALGLLANGGRAFHRRDVQLFAALPLPGDGRDVPGDGHWLEWMTANGWLAREDGVPTSLMSSRLQLAFPWLVTRDSADCQGGVEAPEGSLAGVLARGALERGAFRSIAGSSLSRYIDAHRSLDWTRLTQHEVPTPLGLMTFAERVCLIGPAARGPAVLSDVTCAADASVRQGAVRRLVNVVIQAARALGDEFAFDVSNEALWDRVREQLNDLGRTLLVAGALSTDGAPFVVRCGRDTMTQADLDAGRLIAEIELLPAQPIQRIVVVLAMRDAPLVVELRAA